MQLKYKAILTFISLLLVISLGLGASYLFYKPELEETSLISVVDDLSINYLDGTDFNFSDYNKEIDFSLTNLSNESKKYNIYLLDVNSESSLAKYYINSNVELENDRGSLIDKEEQIVSQIEVASNDTNSYKIDIDNPEAKKVAFKLYVELVD